LGLVFALFNYFWHKKKKTSRSVLILDVFRRGEKFFCRMVYRQLDDGYFNIKTLFIGSDKIR